MRSWTEASPDPFKRKRSPLRDVPGGDDPHRIQPDVMHCFNLGFGKDLAASGVILLCRLRQFPGGSFQSRLDAAYEDFASWCQAKSKTSSLKTFELKTFKVKKQHGVIIGRCSNL